MKKAIIIETDYSILGMVDYSDGRIELQMGDKEEPTCITLDIDDAKLFVSELQKWIEKQ